MGTLYYHLGKVYDNQDNNVKAEEYYVKALDNYTQLFDQNPIVYEEHLALIQNNLVNFYYKMENMKKFDEMVDQALIHYQELYKNNPIYKDDLVELSTIKGMRLLEKGLLSEAFQVLEPVYQLNEEDVAPTLAQAFYTLAFVLYYKADFFKAMEAIDRAITLDPDKTRYKEFKNEVQEKRDEDSPEIERGLSILFNDLRKTIVYLYENPTSEQIVNWRRTYDNTCSYRIVNEYEKYNIDGGVLYHYPSLVYLIIFSSSIPEHDAKQKLFDQIPTMKVEQIFELYRILYIEQYKLGKSN